MTRLLRPVAMLPRERCEARLIFSRDYYMRPDSFPEGVYELSGTACTDGPYAFVARCPASLTAYDGEPVLVVVPWAGCDLECSTPFYSPLDLQKHGILDVLSGEFWPMTEDYEKNCAGMYQHCDPPCWVIFTSDDADAVPQVRQAGIPVWVDDGRDDTPKEVPETP